MKVDGKRGERWETRAGSQDELSCPVDRWQPERRRDEKRSFFLLYLPLPASLPLLLSLSLAVWPTLSLPLGLIKQTVGSTHSGGELWSAGINLCDRGLLDESDHPCWLTQWMEPALTERGGSGESHTREGRGTTDSDLTFRNYLFSFSEEDKKGCEGRD